MPTTPVWEVPAAAYPARYAASAVLNSSGLALGRVAGFPSAPMKEASMRANWMSGLALADSVRSAAMLSRRR